MTGKYAGMQPLLLENSVAVAIPASWLSASSRVWTAKLPCTSSLSNSPSTSLSSSEKNYWSSASISGFDSLSLESDTNPGLSGGYAGPSPLVIVKGILETTWSFLLFGLHFQRYESSSQVIFTTRRNRNFCRGDVINRSGRSKNSAKVDAA